MIDKNNSNGDMPVATGITENQAASGIVLPKSNEESSALIIDIIEIIRILLRRKKFIIASTLIITCGAIIISLLLPESFKSSSILLPEADKSKLAGLGGLSDLASMAGVNTGEASLVKLYPTILKSEAILKPVIYKKFQTKKFSDSVNLIQYWEINAKNPALEYEAALKLLKSGLDVSMDVKTSIITLTFEAEEPQLTADIINAITAELDRYMRTKRMTNATKQRQWIEIRLDQMEHDLSTSENLLREFREKNRIVAGSPLLMLEQERLVRNVQINTTLFGELKKQSELVKIEEIKNIPIVNVLDAAIPAARKESPKRGFIVIVSFFFGLIGSIAYAYIEHNYTGQIITMLSKIKK